MCKFLPSRSESRVKQTVPNLGTGQSSAHYKDHFRVHMKCFNSKWQRHKWPRSKIAWKL